MSPLLPCLIRYHVTNSVQNFTQKIVERESEPVVFKNTRIQNLITRSVSTTRFQEGRRAGGESVLTWDLRISTATALLCWSTALCLKAHIQTHAVERKRPHSSLTGIFVSSSPPTLLTTDALLCVRERVYDSSEVRQTPSPCHPIEQHLVPESRSNQWTSWGRNHKCFSIPGPVIEKNSLEEDLF